MILNIDVSDKDFICTLAPAPKLDQNKVQRTDKDTGEPMWSTQVSVVDDSGGEIINITTRGKEPDIRVGDVVLVDDLVATPWFSNNRSGVAYKAESVRAAD